MSVGHQGTDALALSQIQTPVTGLAGTRVQQPWQLDKQQIGLKCNCSYSTTHCSQAFKGLVHPVTFYLSKYSVLIHYKTFVFTDSEKTYLGTTIMKQAFLKNIISRYP